MLSGCTASLLQFRVARTARRNSSVGHVAGEAMGGEPSGDTLHEVIVEAARGDPEALEKLLSFVRTQIAHGSTAHPGRDLRALEDTQDVVQEVQLRLLRCLGKTPFSDWDALGRWIRLTARRVLRDRRRYFQAKKRSPGERILRPLSLDELDFEPASCEDTPVAAALKSERRLAVLHALSRLPERKQLVIRLHEFEALSFPQIASRLGFPSSDAARKEYARALLSLGSVLRGKAR